MGNSSSKNYNLYNKSYQFSLKIILTSERIRRSRKEYILSGQLLRSGTSIGAQIRESKYAESRPDFIHKHYIALKEANEAKYWINLLTDTGYLHEDESIELTESVLELIKILVAIIRKLKY